MKAEAGGALDVEGAEYAILEDAVNKSLFCKQVLDEITIEWHDKVWPFAGRRESRGCPKTDEGVRLGCKVRNKKSRKMSRDRMVGLIREHPENCTATHFKDVDDERYHYDGVHSRQRDGRRSGSGLSILPNSRNCGTASY